MILFILPFRPKKEKAVKEFLLVINSFLIYATLLQ